MNANVDLEIADSVPVPANAETGRSREFDEVCDLLEWNFFVKMEANGSPVQMASFAPVLDGEVPACILSGVFMRDLFHPAESTAVVFVINYVDSIIDKHEFRLTDATPWSIPLSMVPAEWNLSSHEVEDLRISQDSVRPERITLSCKYICKSNYVDIGSIDLTDPVLPYDEQRLS